MKLVIFDCDGTIVDSQHMIVAAMNAAFAMTGRAPPPREAVLSVVGLSLVEAILGLCPEAAPDEAIALAESYKAAFQALRRSGNHTEPLYPGLRACIEDLAARPDVLLGIATGKSRRGVAAVLEREDLARCFHTVQTADTHPSKPHPSMIHAAMAEAGSEPATTVLIGDTVFDIEMARSAGVAAIAVSWGYHPRSALIDAGADATCDSGEELVGAVDRIWARTRRVA